MNTQEKEESLTLEILQAIEQQNDVTQRHLADNMGVALGLANSYLKRCVRKGLVKIQQVPANRYLYYLTPKGFAEKSRLTAKYLTVSFDFYRNASQSFSEIFTLCEQQGHKKILFCGVSELAEIASIRSHDHQLQITGVYDPLTTRQKFLDLPVWKSIDAAGEFHACVLTALENPQEMYESLITEINPDSVFVPEILGINVSQKQFPSPLAGEKRTNKPSPLMGEGRGEGE